MTATVTTTGVSLPKNKTGIYASNTANENKPVRSSPNTLVRPTRTTASANALITLSEQNHSQAQQYRPLNTDQQQSADAHRVHGTQREKTDSILLNKTVLRSGFRPSPIRRQRQSEPSSTIRRDSKESLPKPLLIPAHTSTKLKSEIDHLANKIKVHGEINKILQAQTNRDTSSTPRSALSFATSLRSSSACTNCNADRSHQRFPSAMTVTMPANTIVSVPGHSDASNKSVYSFSAITESAIKTIDEESQTPEVVELPITHAYQIPQQSNVGSDSVFPLNPPPPPSLCSGPRSKTVDTRSTRNRSVLCPFYVMYFTNLTLQHHQQSQHSNEINRPTLPLSAALRKDLVNSRTSTNNSRLQSTMKKRINTPTSMNTFPSLENNENNLTQTTSYYDSKRFFAKIAAFEHENTHLLKNVLRTTSWNHVQV